MEAVIPTAPPAFEIREVPSQNPAPNNVLFAFGLFNDARATLTQRCDGVVRVMLGS